MSCAPLTEELHKEQFSKLITQARERQRGREMEREGEKGEEGGKEEITEQGVREREGEREKGRERMVAVRGRGRRRGTQWQPSETSDSDMEDG